MPSFSRTQCDIRKFQMKSCSDGKISHSCILVTHNAVTRRTLGLYISRNSNTVKERINRQGKSKHFERENYRGVRTDEKL
jgi:hypothetical protein